MHTMMSPTMIGFDHLFRLLDTVEEKTPKYPPYDLMEYEEGKFRITMAVAGFGEDELSVRLEQNRLYVKGEKQSAEDPARYLHKGIATRDFERVFRLGPHMMIMGAEMRGGLLSIELERQIPEALKPREIEIKTAPRMIEGSKG